MKFVSCLFILLFALVCCLYVPLFAQPAGDKEKEMLSKGDLRDKEAIDDAINGWWTASMKTHDHRIQWWKEARFGMFIHWGIYSLPGGEWKGKKVNGYAEHLMRKEKITRSEYLKLAHRFNPVKFNAEKWILNAKKAGMKYFIITSKHHDGFAMFNSQVSDFNIVDQTPFKRDPMAELAAAAKKYGIKFGFYYSHAFDWEHPDAPGNDWEYKNPGGDLNLYGGRRWYDLHPDLLEKAKRYVDQKAIPQIKELITKYHPDILWFDTPQKLPLSENIRILKAIRETDPDVVVNGRLVRSAAANFGDYKNTADRPAEFFPVTGNWEAIPTTNESYGYSKYDSSHKPPAHFIRLLANAASRGGNLLMNIGPRGDGSFDPRDLNILEGIGEWMRKNGESIYQTNASPLPLQSWGVSTVGKNKLYLHVFNWPTDGKLYVGGLKSAVGKLYFLARPNKLLEAEKAGAADLVINIPKAAPDTANTVIVMELKDSLKTDSIRYVSSNIPVTRLLAFDAGLHGKGFGFGDGKTARYYIDGWRNKDQYLVWHFRTSVPITCRILIKYIAGEESGGIYQLKADNHIMKNKVEVQSKAGAVITQEIGELRFDTGVHEWILSPLEISSRELMKPLELQLIPK